MIVRIMGEGQLEVPDAELATLNGYDDAVQKALDGGDDEIFRAALIALLDRVRTIGTPIPSDALVPSDLILPAADAHVDEVRTMLSDDGLIPD